MSIRLIDRDYRSDGAGGLKSGGSAEQVLDEVLFRLSARRGALPMLPELGSEMYRLRSLKPSARQTMAREYAVQALADLDEATVTDAQVTEGADGLRVTVDLQWQGESLRVEWEG